MDGRVANLHCRCRLLGDPARVAAARRELEIARDHLQTYLERYTDQVFADDPRVIVIRHLHDRTLLALNRHADTEAPARQWAASITRALTRRVHSPRADTGEMIIFADQAEFVCQFLADSLPGRQTARHWYYGAFSRYRRHAFEQQVYHLLADNRAHLRPILGQLRQHQLLAQLCRVLRGWPLIVLWSQAVESAQSGSEHEILARHLLEYWIAAGQFTAGDGLDRIGHLLNTLPDIHSVPDLNMFRDLLAERDKGATSGRRDRVLTALTHRLITEAGAWPGTPPGVNEAFAGFSTSLDADWRDRASLTAYVENAIQYLWERNRLGGWPQTGHAARKRHLERVLEPFDWLDRPRLQRFLLALLVPGGGVIRQRRGTPRQVKLIAALREALFEPQLFGRHGVDISDPGAFRLAAYTALIARHPYWADDTLAARFIDLLASAVAAGVTKQTNPMAGAFQAFGPDADALLRDLTTAASGTAPSSPPAPLKPHHSGPNRKSPTTVNSAAAGSLLLLRAIADTRLQQCCAKGDSLEDRRGLGLSEPFHLLLLPLLARLAGGGALANGRLDSGLALLTGDDTETHLAHWRAAWEGGGEALIAAVTAHLWRTQTLQQRLEGRHLHLHRLPGDGRPLWVLGDGECQRWICVDIRTAADGTADLEQLIEQWRAVYGRTPESLAADRPGGGAPELLAPGGQPIDRAASLPRHSADRQALDDLLAAFTGPAIGPPGADTGLSLAANLLLRAWARWLPGFGRSSAGYLLHNAIRRGGRIEYDQHSIAVHLDAAPLDIVIKLARYLDKMERVPWLGNRDLIFHSRS